MDHSGHLEEDAVLAGEEGAHGHMHCAAQLSATAAEGARLAREARKIVHQHHASHRALPPELPKPVPNPKGSIFQGLEPIAGD
eukprot:1237154-Pyramimonas_sp.AAC.1